MNRTLTEDLIVDEVLNSEYCDVICELPEKYAEIIPDYEEFCEEFQNGLLKLIEYAVDKGVSAAAKAFIFSAYPQS